MIKKSQHWQPKIPHISLQYDEIHVWQVNLDQPENNWENIFEILSTDEKERASRFHFEKDKRRFTVARGILRQILGRYLNEKPHKIQFEYSPYGKPRFGSESGFGDLKFNLSHSEDLGLVAITQNRNIGIDLERIRQDLYTEEIAARFFCENERNSLEKLCKTEKNARFFQYWTRKEAFLKCMGKGLSFPMENCDVSLTAGKEFSSLKIQNEISGWQVKDLFPYIGYAAAIVIEGENSRISCIEFQS